MWRSFSFPTTHKYTRGMITSDQPTIFPEGFFVVTSSSAEGVIRYPPLDDAAPRHIRAWCRQLDIPLQQTVGLYITYGDKRTYTDIVELTDSIATQDASTKEGWVAADAFVTSQAGIAMLLPVADCNAVVYVDPVRKVMALAHLGWHSTVRNLASKVVHHMVTHFQSQPEDILIYNSPSIRAASYHFTHLAQTDITHWHAEPYAVRQADGAYAIDLVKYNYDQWCEAGIVPKNIQVIDVDTATSGDYPSHFTGQNSRFAVMAMIKK